MYRKLSMSVKFKTSHCSNCPLSLYLNCRYIWLLRELQGWLNYFRLEQFHPPINISLKISNYATCGAAWGSSWDCGDNITSPLIRNENNWKFQIETGRIGEELCDTPQLLWHNTKVLTYIFMQNFQISSQNEWQTMGFVKFGSFWYIMD